MIVLLGLVLGACSSSSHAAPRAASLPLYRPRLLARPCAYRPALRTRVDCYWLVVPEDRARPAARTVRLAVAVLHSHAAHPRPDPVVYLHGGPGGDAVAGARNGWDTDSRLRERDVILFDQRGSGLSQPSLNCPEIEAAIRARFETAAPFAVEFAARRRAVQRCRDRLLRNSIDLSAYDTDASAADLNDLRVALGIRTWNLLGVSYGTRLALDEMRRYPSGIRSVLLDSVYPPDVGGLAHVVAGGERAVRQLVDGCASEPVCATAYPHLAQLIDRAYSSLTAHPYRGTVNLGAGKGGKIPLAIEGADLIGGVYSALYDERLIPILPSAIAALAHGNDAIIPPLAQQAIPFATSQSEGAYLSVDCADSQHTDSADNQRVLADPGRWSVVLTESSAPYCGLWHVPSERDFATPVHSDIPTLVLAGRYDPVTPPADSQATARALTHATFVEIDGIGHGVIFSNPCGSAIYRSFLDNPAKPDTTCATHQPPPAFR